MEGMRELLREALGKALSTLEPVDRLAAAWPVACGRALAERGVVTAFAEGVVTIEVRDSSWLPQLQSMREQLTGELRRIAGVELRAIHFEGSQAGPRSLAGMVKNAPAPRAARRSRRKQE